MKKVLLGVLLLTAAASVHGAEAPVAPYEIAAKPTAADPVDALVLASLAKREIEPANLCSDEVFIRRVTIDVTGSLPDPLDVSKFLADRRPDKRSALIDELLESEAFADYQSLKWCDLLRVKAEFPINLWPNSVQAYHRWIRDAVRDNKPYDQFVRELLTSSGSNFRVPPVNFYRAIQSRDPGAIADAAALTFMGVRTEGWPEARRAGMAAFFSRLAYKTTAEWKEEIVQMDPAPAGPLDAVFPDGTAVRIAPGEDPRRVFADWLIAAENPWFARNIVNRVWSWMFGRGIIHEPDDIRPDNPPVNPELLAYLEKELVDSGYDLRHIFRLTLNSGAYQQSSIPRSDHPEAEALFAHYPVRRLDAEVLIDALCRIAGDGEKYSSPIPEPFTYIPEHQPTIALADGSITSQFLEMFGRPARDTGLESERENKPTSAQRLHMLNSTHVQQKIQNSVPLRELMKRSRGNMEQMFRGTYMLILSRSPTPEEMAAARKYATASKLNPKQAQEDLAWALVNSKEFLYRH
jgi:hypothetical protein